MNPKSIQFGPLGKLIHHFYKTFSAKKKLEISLVLYGLFLLFLPQIIKCRNTYSTLLLCYFILYKLTVIWYTSKHFMVGDISSSLLCFFKN